MSFKVPRRPLDSFVCTQCQLRTWLRHQKRSKPTRLVPARQFFSVSKLGAEESTESAKRPKVYYSELQNRSLVRLDGPDAADFLHNLIPAQVLPLDGSSKLLATVLLNAKGRITHDLFVYKPTKETGNEWLLDVDANAAPALLSTLRKHKLRSKFKLEILPPDEARITYVWPNHEISDGSQKMSVMQDPRPGMGKRVYIWDRSTSGNPLLSGFKNTLANELGVHGDSLQELEWEDYRIHRMLNGHAEGPVEIVSGHALPQESNFDFYGGIDFHKGCYLGQELTIRTHHTGVVRKRILPVQIYSEDQPLAKDQSGPAYDQKVQLPQPLHEANISKCGARGRSGRGTGKWLGGYGNIGLALCRLETMTDLSLTAEGSSFNPDTDEFRVSWEEAGGENDRDGRTIMKEVRVKAFVPPWLRQGIEESIRARSERSKKRRDQDEEEDDDDELD